MSTSDVVDVLWWALTKLQESGETNDTIINAVKLHLNRGSSDAYGMKLLKTRYWYIQTQSLVEEGLKKNES